MIINNTIDSILQSVMIFYVFKIINAVSDIFIGINVRKKKALVINVHNVMYFIFIS